jgi:fatty acid synthase
MFPNRISYAFDFNGPSGAYDTACSSSSYALEAAVSAIREGTCDAAVVAGSSLILNPHSTLPFQKLGMLSSDSSCKTFDASGELYSYISIYFEQPNYKLL